MEGTTLSAANDVELKLAGALGVTQGLVTTLDGLEEELCDDARYYALLACLKQLQAILEQAADSCDQLKAQLYSGSED